MTSQMKYMYLNTVLGYIFEKLDTLCKEYSSHLNIIQAEQRSYQLINQEVDLIGPFTPLLNSRIIPKGFILILYWKYYCLHGSKSIHQKSQN